MKKICYVTTIHNTLRGIVLKSAIYLHEHGNYDITFVCADDKEFANSLPDYIHFKPIKMKRGINPKDICAIFQMYKFFKKEKFDIIQYSTPNASLYASIAAFFACVPVRLYCQWGLVFEGFSGFKRKLLMMSERLVCKLSTWVEPDSFGNLAYCRELGLYSEKKSSVVLNGSAVGVSLEKFDLSQKEQFRVDIRSKYLIPTDGFVFGFLGITGDKGVNEFMAAGKQMLQKYDDVYCILIGESEKEYSIDATLIDWAKNEDRMIFTGSTKVVQNFMAAMDCYVTASYREGFGTTVIEAGAMALPVITSNIPGPTDAIKHNINGLVVEKKNPKELLKAMDLMYSDRKLCEQYGEKGYEMVKEKYDQKAVLPAILEDRDRLLKKL